jgi:hypothetical protein
VVPVVVQPVPATRNKRRATRTVPCILISRYGPLCQVQAQRTG